MPAAAVVAALVVVTLIVQRHTLRAFFALDDLVMFQQAAGVRPWPVSPWRWLSGGVWFRAVVPMWGHEPFPYHAVSLLVHVVNVLLLHRLARRWGASPVAAFVGAALFGLSRLHFPALLAATSIGELLALSLTLVALLVVAPGMRMMAAVAAFVLALSAKESVLLVPFAAVLVCVTGDSVRARTRALAPLLVAGFAFGALLLWNGIGSGRLGGEAYAVSFGANLFENIARLFGWSIDVLDPIPDLHATTTGAAHVVLPLLALVLTALASRLRLGGLLRAGVAWWWLAILPVLPLPGRTYLHYLYVHSQARRWQWQRCGMWRCVGALLGRAWPRHPGELHGVRRWRWCSSARWALTCCSRCVRTCAWRTSIGRWTRCCVRARSRAAPSATCAAHSLASPHAYSS